MSDARLSVDTARLEPDLRGLLTRLARRIRMYVILEGTAMVLVLLAALFWISLGVDWAWFQASRLELPVWFRAGFGVVVVGLAAAGLTSWVLLRLLRRFRARALALVLERRFPELDDRLITAVERADSTAPDETPLTGAMFDRTVRDVLEAARRIELGEVFQKAPLLRAVLVATVLVSSIGGFARLQPAAMARWNDAYIRLLDSYWDRECALEVTVERRPGQTAGTFREQDGALVYRHPRGEDLKLIIKSVGKRVPDQVRISYRQAGGSGRAHCASLPDGTFRHSRSGLLEDMTFSITGGDYTNRVPFRVLVRDPPQVDRVELACRYPEYTRWNPPGDPAARTTQVVQGIRAAIPIETDFALVATINKPFVRIDVRFDPFHLTLGPARDDPTRWEATLTREVGEGEASQAAQLDPAAMVGGDSPRRFVLPCVMATDAARLLAEAIDRAGDHGEFLELPLPLPADSQLKITITDTDDIISSEPSRLTIEGIVDTPPTIETELRGIGTAITRMARIPIAGTIRDDYGVTDVRFEYRVVEAGKKPAAAGGTGDWKSRTLDSPPPETAWPREFPLATADPDDIPRDPKLRTPDDGQVAWFRVLPLDLKEGQRLVLTVTATDTDDLNGPHTTRGDPPNTFTIVSAEELQFTLYQKELNLRRRFEQVITEVQQTRDDVDKHLEQVRQRKAKLAYGPAVPVSKELRDIDRNVAACAERSINATSKSRNETAAVAQSFADIREELINNAIHTRQALERIDDGILTPLQRVLQDDYTEVDSTVRAFARANRSGGDPQVEAEDTIAALDSLLVRMQQVLTEMRRLETFQEALKLLKLIIDDQEDLQKETREARKRELIRRLQGKSKDDEKQDEKQDPSG